MSALQATVKSKGRKRGTTYSSRHVNRLISEEKQKFKQQFKKRLRVQLEKQHDQPTISLKQAAISVPSPPIFPLAVTRFSPCVPNVEYAHASSEGKASRSKENVIEKSIHEASFSQEKIDSLVTRLNSWAVDCKVPQNTYTKLLKILKEDLGLLISGDARTVLKVKSVVPYKTYNVPSGCYYHFGLKESIATVLDRFSFMPTEPLQLEINVDGLPLAKSSGSQFWPILCNIENLKNDFVFAIGVYHGFNKLANPNDFLKRFADDFLQISQQGFRYKEKDVSIKITKFLCDAPAKAFILNIKSHNAYFGCTKCSTEGNFINNRMTYPELNAPLRTDESFKNMSDEYFHKDEATSMLQLNIGLVSKVPLDYMHLVCLGVTKKLLLFWVKGNQSVRFNSSQLANINDGIEKFRKASVLEFVRKPRALNEVERFKATELRQFLLYYGPVLLKSNLSRTLYMHFMCLHCAIRILATKHLCLKYNQFAVDLLKHFVENFGEHYGDEYVNHNVHNLIHLPADVLEFGPLDNFSCFKFENYMHTIKMSLKNMKFPLRHFVHKINEFNYFSTKPMNKNDIQLSKPLGSKATENGEHLNYFGRVYFHGHCLTVTEPNCFFILKQSQVPAKLEIIYVQGTEIYIVYKKFLSFDNSFDRPCPSKLFHCGIVGDLSEKTETILLNDGFLNKCVKTDNFIISLIHTA